MRPETVNVYSAVARLARLDGGDGTVGFAADAYQHPIVSAVKLARPDIVGAAYDRRGPSSVTVDYGRGVPRIRRHQLPDRVAQWCAAIDAMHSAGAAVSSRCATYLWRAVTRRLPLTCRCP
jgi:hypothetical protein